MLSDEILIALLVVAAGAVLGLQILFLRASPEAKNKWFPRVSVLVGLTAIIVTFAVVPQRRIMFLFIPGVVLITAINALSIGFCPKCGALYQTLGWLYRVRFCAKCGTEFQSR